MNKKLSGKGEITKFIFKMKKKIKYNNNHNDDDNDDDGNNNVNNVEQNITMTPDNGPGCVRFS